MSPKNQAKAGSHPPFPSLFLGAKFKPAMQPYSVCLNLVQILLSPGVLVFQNYAMPFPQRIGYQYETENSKTDKLPLRITKLTIPKLVIRKT